MEDVLDDFDRNPLKIDEDNLLKKIWLEPTATLSYILQNCPQKNVLLFLVIGGILRVINRASMRDMGDDFSTITILGIALIVGGLFGWMSYYVYAWALSVTGKWLDGKTLPTTFRTILAWSLVPSICTLFLLVPEVIIFGDDLFKSVPENHFPYFDTIFLSFAVAEFVLGIWTLVILVQGIKLVQEFSTGRAILNLLLPGLVLIGFVLVIALFFSLF